LIFLLPQQFSYAFQEGHRLEFRAEFNLFNRVNLNSPNTSKTLGLLGELFLIDIEYGRLLPRAVVTATASEGGQIQ